MVDTAQAQFPQSMARAIRPAGAADLESYAGEALERIKGYARDEPVSFALWAFGVGFVLGWKLKPW